MAVKIRVKARGRRKERATAPAIIAATSGASCSANEEHPIYCDNVSTVYLSTNSIRHQRTKRIDIDLHFVRERVTIDDVRVLHALTTY
jgi:hypothetical protein